MACLSRRSCHHFHTPPIAATTAAAMRVETRLLLLMNPRIALMPCPKRSQDLVDTQIDVARLRRLPALPQQELKQVDPPFENSHEIASVRENHHPPARGVGFDAVL